MKARKIDIGNESVYLRLTASRLAEFAENTGTGGNTLFAVMDALDDVSKQGRLLTAALTYRGNSNQIQDGFELIDALADADYSALGMKELIVTLAVDGGIVGRDDAEKLKNAIRAGSEKLYAAAAAILSGNASSLAGTAEPKTEGEPENPT